MSSLRRRPSLCVPRKIIFLGVLACEQKCRPAAGSTHRRAHAPFFSACPRPPYLRVGRPQPRSGGPHPPPLIHVPHLISSLVFKPFGENIMFRERQEKVLPPGPVPSNHFPDPNCTFPSFLTFSHYYPSQITVFRLRDTFLPF